MTNDTLAKIALVVAVITAIFVIVPAAKEAADRRALHSTLTPAQLKICKDQKMRAGCRLTVGGNPELRSVQFCKFYRYACGW